MTGRAPLARRLISSAGTTLVAGLAVLTLVPVVFGVPRPMVQVAWHEDADAARAAAETQFSLSETQPIGPREFLYVPDDTSTSTLAALVAHPAVLATEGVDRRTGAILGSAPLTARRGGVVTAPRAARVVKAAGALLVALGCVLAAAAIALRVSAVRTAVDRWRASRHGPGWSLAPADGAHAALTWLQQGIPAASPEAAGLFRIVFVSGVLTIAILEPAAQRPIPPAEVEAVAGPYGAIVRALASDPSSLRHVDTAVRIFGALAIAGLATRVTFAVFVGAFLLWACAFTTRTTLHSVSALQLTLVALTAARWHEAWSLDAWLARRRRGQARRHPPGRQYGFAAWVPGFVLSLAYFAAAWAKVGHGPAWILNGTVRQHFLTDLDHAWTSWGPAITSPPAAAIALSAAAIAVETLAISAAFVPSWRYRLAIGGTVLSLLAGFALFQGIVWTGWWVLLLGFLPWQLIGRHAPDTHTAIAATRPQLGAVVALLLLQAAGTALMRDFRPFVSGYDMYATTHGPEIDNARGLERVRVVAASLDGWREVPGCTVELPAAAQSPGAAATRGALGDHLSSCLREEQTTAIRLDLDRQTYDWSSHGLRWRTRVDVAGPFASDALPAAWPFRE